MREAKTLFVGFIIVVGADRSAGTLRRCRPLQELGRMGSRSIIARRATLAWSPLRRIAADLGL